MESLLALLENQSFNWNLALHPMNTSRDAGWLPAFRYMDWGMGVSLNVDDDDGCLYLLNSTGFIIKTLAKNCSGMFTH